MTEVTNTGTKISFAFLIGTGGIGSNLVEQLVRLLMYHPNGTLRVIVADGDVYEVSNLQRQLFSRHNLNKNKAVATAERLDFAPNIMAIDRYIDQDMMSKMLGKIKHEATTPILVVTAVDNHSSRRAIVQALDESGLSYILVLASNGYETIQVSMHAKLDQQDLTVHPFIRYPDIESASNPLPGSCGYEAPVFPQLLAANFLAAAATLLMVNSILDGHPVADEITGDIYKYKLKPSSNLTEVK